MRAKEICYKRASRQDTKTKQKPRQDKIGQNNTKLDKHKRKHKDIDEAKAKAKAKAEVKDKDKNKT